MLGALFFQEVIRWVQVVGTGLLVAGILQVNQDKAAQRAAAPAVVDEEELGLLINVPGADLGRDAASGPGLPGPGPREVQLPKLRSEPHVLGGTLAAAAAEPAAAASPLTPTRLRGRTPRPIDTASSFALGVGKRPDEFFASVPIGLNSAAAGTSA